MKITEKDQSKLNSLTEPLRGFSYKLLSLEIFNNTELTLFQK